MDPTGNMHHFEYEVDSNGYRLKPKRLATTTTAAPTVEVPTCTSTTTKAPLRLKFEPVPIIGPIPKTWTQLFGPDAESDEELDIIET